MNPTNILKQRWLFLVLFCLINFFTGALYVWSVFASAIAEHFTTLNPDMPVTVAMLGSVFGLATGLTPVLMLAGGFINDRFGPRWIILVGGVCLAVGYAMSAMATAVSELYLSYGLLVGAGTGLINGCTINSAVKFFPERRGFAGGTVCACLGIGGALLPLLANGLIASLGISQTLFVFAALLGGVIVLSALPLKRCPDNLAEMLGLASKANTECKSVKDVTWLGMVRTPLFYSLFILFAVMAMLGLMMLSNISEIAKNQMSFNATLVALSISVLSLANTAGRFLSGTISDKVGRLLTLGIALFIAIGSLLCLYFAKAGDDLLFFVGLLGVGLSFGSSFGVYPGLVADEFGAKHNSVNFSVMAFAYSLGGFGGPLIIRWVTQNTETQSGNYDLAYLLALGMAVVGLLCLVWSRQLIQREKVFEADSQAATVNA